MPLRISPATKSVLIYGLALAALLLLLTSLQVRYLIIDHSVDIYMGTIALLFTILGMWIAIKLLKPKTEIRVVEKEVFVSTPQSRPSVTVPPNGNAARHLGLSSREMEVLQLMAVGLSNQEIAENLFLSLNTIKTHSSNLFVKMDVKRRTQAVDKARNLGIIT